MSLLVLASLLASLASACSWENVKDEKPFSPCPGDDVSPRVCVVPALIPSASRTQDLTGAQMKVSAGAEILDGGGHCSGTLGGGGIQCDLQLRV